MLSISIVYFGDILSTHNPVDLCNDFIIIVISNESECYFGETKEQDGLVSIIISNSLELTLVFNPSS